MKEDKTVPQLRFPEFTDAWKQRKFGDVLVSIQTGTNKLGSDRNSGQPLLKMGNLQSGYFDLSKLEFLENKAEPENIVKQGDFFFNTRNTLELVGKGATWFGESNKYAFNSNIARFTLKDINTGFFNYLYNTNYVKKQIRARAMGTTSVAAIYPRSLKSVDIVIPNMEEQIKLSNLFMNLDSTITLQQRKLNSHQKLKKGLFQKMFPKNGENIPEIRFPEFSDAWKQRKLSESAKFSKGNGYSKSDVTTKGIPLVLYGRLYTNYETVISNIDTYSELENEGSVVSKGGEIIVPASGETAEDISRASVIKDSGVLIGGDLNIICPSNDIIPSFLALTITYGNVHKEMTKLAQGKTVVHLHNSDLYKIRFFVPSYNEQLRITALFSNIESTITLQQRKLEFLQKLKKGLLQQMFI